MEITIVDVNFDFLKKLKICLFINLHKFDECINIDIYSTDDYPNRLYYKNCK